MSCPTWAATLWEAFREISASRDRDKPIAYAEIKAWSDLMRESLTPEEAYTIKLLDAVYLQQIRE